MILAVAGSAVGLGNFLRFPGVAVEHGGGAFMIPYFTALLLLGIPLGWAEWTLGRLGGTLGVHSAPAILGAVGRSGAARFAGTIGVLVPLVVFMYYALIESWCLTYALTYLFAPTALTGTDGASGANASAFFGRVTGVAEDGVLLSGFSPQLGAWLLVLAVNLWLIHRGLSRGIEAFCRWAMPAMAVAAAVVLVRVLTLGTPDPSLPDRNVEAGLGFLWNPDFSRLGDFETWLAAAGQVFFSLSVGFGVILNYASYLDRKDDVVLSGLTASATNEVFEVAFGGLITVTAAFVFLGPGGAAGGTFGLGFNTLPVVFLHMGPSGRFIGALWFLLLFAAAVTSSLSMLHPVKAFLMESLGIPAGRAVAVLGAIAGLGSLWVLYFSKDLEALDTLDFWVGTLGIFLLASVQLACFVGALGVDRGIEHAHEGARMHIPRVYRFVLRYVAPAYMLIVFVGFCAQKLPGYVAGLRSDPVALATLGLVAVVFAGLAALVGIGRSRWQALLEPRPVGDRVQP